MTSPKEKIILIEYDNNIYEAYSLDNDFLEQFSTKNEVEAIERVETKYTIINYLNYQQLIY